MVSPLRPITAPVMEFGNNTSNLTSSPSSAVFSCDFRDTFQTTNTEVKIYHSLRVFSQTKISFATRFVTQTLDKLSRCLHARMCVFTVRLN